VEDVCVDPLLQDILVSSKTFGWISFRHIYRELNGKSDELLKYSLSLPVRTLDFYEFIDGEELEFIKFRFKKNGL